jgi:hypothetical protein
MKNTFIFSDESGTKKHDRYFLIGFLKIVNPDKYFKTLSLYRDKLFGISREQRVTRISNLKKINDIDQVAELAKNPFRFELKYSKVNNYNFKFYQDFVRTLLDVGVEFVVVGIDRKDPNFNDNAKLIASYKRIINQYLQKYGNHNEHCYIVDDFGVRIESICDPKLLSDYYARQLSDSTIYLQAVDVLTGLIQFGLTQDPSKSSKKDIPRRNVLATLENYFDLSVTGNLTKQKKKSYLSIWILNFDK